MDALPPNQLAQQTMPTPRSPLKLLRDFVNTKWTKQRVSWAIAYIYTLYVAVAAVPPLKGTPAFSVASLSALLVLLYLFHSFTNLSLKNASMYLAIAAVISYVWEFVGVETGIPFGHYSYTSALGPELGPVPVFIPLIWCALGYFCLQASDHYIMASALMVALDLSFDPVFSTSLNLWKWTGQTQYFGVPLTNFFGWFITSLTFFTAFYYTTRRKAKSSTKAIGFFYLFGLDNVVGDLVSGPVALAAASFVIFTLATSIVFLIHRSKTAQTKVLQTEQIANLSQQPAAMQ